MKSEETKKRIKTIVDELDRHMIYLTESYESDLLEEGDDEIASLLSLTMAKGQKKALEDLRDKLD